MQALKAKIDSEARTAEQDVESHVDSSRDASHKSSKDRGRAGRHREVGQERKAVTDEKIAEWKAKLEKAKLKGRAEAAERYAAGAVVVASAAVDEAEQASLEAWFARKDADSAQDTNETALNDVALRRRLVAEEPLAGLSAEVAGVAHLLRAADRRYFESSKPL